MTFFDVARVAHNINRAYCRALGDDSQKPWEDAPEWQRESAVNGVIFHMNNPDATPKDSHDSWCEQKLADGWQYGEVKDADKKEHPCLVPYELLTVEQRAKDYLLREVCHSLKPFID